MGVHEARDDGSVLVAGAGSEVGSRAHGGDDPILDRDGAVRDRRALDREDPVGGDYSAHDVRQPSRPAFSQRRSKKTQSQIVPS